MLKPDLGAKYGPILAFFHHLDQLSKWDRFAILPTRLALAPDELGLGENQISSKSCTCSDFKFDALIFENHIHVEVFDTHVHGAHFTLAARSPERCGVPFRPSPLAARRPQ